MRLLSRDILGGPAPLLLLLGLSLLPAIAWAGDEADDDDATDQAGDDGTDIKRSDTDDVDDWSFEGEKVVKEEKKEEVTKRELPPEPKRSGTSGNWYEVTVECHSCADLLGQKLGIEDPLVMREFFDFIQVNSDRKGGKFVFPSISENRPLGIADGGSSLLIWQYAIDTGTRLTDTYALIWDLRVMADGGLLYGRKYEVQAWTAEAYEEWERGYKAKESFVSAAKLKTAKEMVASANVLTEAETVVL